MQAISASGTILQQGSGSGTITYAAIPGLQKIGAPDTKHEIRETTAHDDPGGFKTYIVTLHDGGDVSASGNLDPTNTAHISLRTAADLGTLTPFKLIMPAPNVTTPGTGATAAFNGYITGIKRTLDVGNPMMQDITIKVSGVITWS